MAAPLTIGRYNIIRELGRGGMAAVYLAHDPATDRDVAIKVLPEQYVRDPQLRERFQHEAKIAAALQNAYIAPVYDYGEEAGQPYLVMRYYPGGTLADRINKRPMPLSDVAYVTLRLAAALDYAHKRNTVHRDVKPKNVLVDDEGEIALSDFGIAKLLQETGGLTATGAMVGTPHYMSPEQFTGGSLDGRSDLYSLGVMVFEMLTGRLPYQGDSAYALMTQHTQTPVPDVDTPRLLLPDVCNAVVKRALAKNPADRYATAGEFARALNSLLAQPLAAPISITQPLTPVTRPDISTSAPTTPDVPTGSIPGVFTPGVFAPGVSPLPITAPRAEAPTDKLTPVSKLREAEAAAPTLSRGRAARMPTAIAPRRMSAWKWVLGGVGGLVGVFVLWWGISFIIGQRPPTPTPTATLMASPALAQTPAPTRTAPPVASATRTPPPAPPTKTPPPPASSTRTSTHTATRTAPPIASATRTPPPPASPTRTSPPVFTDTPAPSATSVPPTNPPPTDTQPPPPTNTSTPPTHTPPPPPPTATPP
jgi:serine/threonine-protein kinase